MATSADTASTDVTGSAAPSAADTLEPWEVADPSTLPDTDYYAIHTSEGRMVIRLYEDTPIHRQNFKKLVAEDFYDGTTFHRIIEEFMVQGGDPYTKDAEIRNNGAGDPGYLLPPEIQPDNFHKRGAVAAARQPDSRNPERRSNGSQFYIVDGREFSKAGLAQGGNKIRKATDNEDFSLNPEARRVYQIEGGAPNLDKQYTVFGELVEGFAVLDSIAASETFRTSEQDPPDQSIIDHPLEPVEMEIEPLPDYEPSGDGNAQAQASAG
jgi:peptidyl-prolyl cis-trans isomerase B (cyclophilin B)